MAPGDVVVEGSLTVGGKSIEEMVGDALEASADDMQERILRAAEEQHKGETKNG